jgi:hypothetical protein
MALTAAENSDVDAGDGAGDVGVEVGGEVGAAEATRVFYLWP